MKRRVPSAFSLGSEKDVRGCNVGGEELSTVSIVLLGASCDGPGLIVLDVFRNGEGGREVGGAKESSIELCSSPLRVAGGIKALICLALLLERSSDADETWDKNVLSSDSAYGLSRAKSGRGRGGCGCVDW